MAVQTAPVTAKHLYALVAAPQALSYGACGIHGGDVYPVLHKGLAALVSDAEQRRVRPERRHIAAHNELLKRVLADTTPLPVTFGTIARDENAVRTLLARNQSQISAQLKRVAGQVEMGLRVKWDVPNIFEYFVTRHEDLCAARDRFVARGQVSADEKMELGRLFERLLNQERETHAENIAAWLTASGVAIRRNPPRQETEILNWACLVERAGRDQFESAVEQAAAGFDDNFIFDVNGPWAPHNFVELDLQM